MSARRRFGELAIERGFITRDILRDGLDEQSRRSQAGQGKQLIGIILVELGHLEADQVFQIMEAIDEEHALGHGQGAGIRQVCLSAGPTVGADSSTDTLKMPPDETPALGIAASLGITPALGVDTGIDIHSEIRSHAGVQTGVLDPRLLCDDEIADAGSGSTELFRMLSDTASIEG
ncbi:MAG: hypothetical protein ACYS22_07805 [Planctomycetota bacterium]|jgi:hypothetical protein